MRIGILGPEGTFSETAALLWLKRMETGNIEEAERQYYETIFDVSESLLRKDVNYGIVPIENSLEGSVGETLDLLLNENREGGMRIVGEILVPITICLLSKGTFTQIRTLASHPHALAQCKYFIRSRLQITGVKVKSVDSTAGAARLAQEDESIAALASAEAAKKYDLCILAENVQDQESVTRFIVLSSAGSKTQPTGRDKTSVIIYLKSDRPGALYDVLGEFAQRGVNLTKIESRPSKRALGDYMFHIDCEGHIEDEEVKEMLKAVERKVAMLKILGSYPMAISF
ncbi:prephenate dehydratase [ANME-1 cluster archaeon GoMg4]|nr:prephenate dehydratase [ANME-1 cluster archaeon GoMg4]